MRRLRRFMAPAVAFVLPSVHAANGNLDSTFNFGVGYQTFFYDLGNGGNNADYTRAALVQHNGDIVLVGRSISGATSAVISLARLLPDGSIDTSFNGGTGRTTFALNSGLYHSDDPYVEAAARDSQDRILVAGDTATDDCSYVARFLANGAIDASFGTGGVYVACPTSGHYIRYLDIGVDTSDRPVVAGAYANLSGDFVTSSALLALRLTTSGAPDPGFNGGSMFTKSIGYVMNSKDRAGAVAFDGSGRIYLGASAQGASYDSEIIMRLTSAGAADTSCGAAGVANIGAAANSDFFPTAIVLRDAHHVFLAGTYTDRSDASTGLSFAEMDADTCAPGSSGVTAPASRAATAARAAAASDGAVYLSFSQLTSTARGSPWRSDVIAFYDTLPYTGQFFGVYTDNNQSSYGEGIAIVSGRPLQALQQQYNGADYDYAVARFENDRIFYGNLERKGAKATFF